MSIFSGEPSSRREATAIERRGTSFEMHTNMKARAGSQGTLFQGGKPVAEHRWPRGYSPVRMAEVSGNLHQQGGGTTVTADKARVLDPDDIGMTHPHLNPFSDDHTRRLMLEPIARSTIHPSHLAHLSGGLNLRVIGGTTIGEAAHYDPNARAINVNRQPWLLTNDPQREIAKSDATLIHEMGHHIDFTTNGAAYNSMANRHPHGFEGIRGMLEHNADTVMMHAFRNDPRNQRKTNFDVRDETYGGRGHAAGAGEGYTDPAAPSRQAENREKLFALKRAQHKARTGEVATQSPLHPGQFKNDVQGALF